MKNLASGVLSMGLLILFWGASSLPAEENVLITEFMAINHTTLADPNGGYPDWIEIYNAGSNAVNLGGWFLTDNAAKLTKWRFPATNLAAYGYLVVFATGNSQTNIAAPLSTSFGLKGSGEYLALIKPDGVTVAWEYAPVFPGQVADISYGLVMDLATNAFVIPGASASYLVPAGDIGSSWQQAGYDDSGWSSGPTGIGFDPSGNYLGLFQTDIGDTMRGINASAYFRLPFNVTDPAALKELRLRMQYDDGFVAYLNGVEVARRNAPDTVSWNSAATALHGLPLPIPSTVQNFDDAGAAYTLWSFSGSFRPRIMPADSGSTGNFLRLADTTGSILNNILFDRTATGGFNSVVATFDFRMMPVGSRADGMGFALLPTSIYGTSGPALGAFTGFGEEPDVAGAIGVGFDIYQNDGEVNNNHVSLHYNGVLISTPVAIPAFDLANGDFHRAQITINFTGGNALVTVMVTPNINSTPGPSEVLFNNFVIPGVSPYEGRAAFGARTGGENANQDLDNVNIQFIPPSTLAFEEFDLIGFRDALQVGGNVLAIQGLNVAADDSDFLIVPELIGREITVLTNSPGFFALPTPGAANLGGAPGFAPAPQFLTAGGLFTNGVSVELATPSSGSEIRYTLDGSEPTSSSMLYTAPIPLSGTTMVRARAFGPRLLPSQIVSDAYTFIQDDMVGFTSNLPLVIINTYGQTVVQGNITAATMTFIETFRGRSSVFLPPDIQVRAGIEIRGQSSTMYPKKGYALETRDEANHGRNVSLLGLPADNDWILDPPYDDKTFMNTFLTLELHEKMGHYAARRRFVEVFLNSSAGNLSYAQSYVGIYELLEKIKISPGRVNIAKLTPADTTEPNISGGYMVKKDKISPGDVLFDTTNGQTLIYHDPKGEKLTLAQQNWIVNYLDQFEQALYAPNWLSATGTNHYSAYIDLNSFVDQHWIVEFTKNIDGYRYSNFMHKDRGGKLFMDPIWDWDLSFGNANYLQGWQTNGWYYAQDGTPPDEPIQGKDHIWLRQLVGLPSGSPPGDPDFKQMVADRWGVLRTNILASANVLARVDEIAALLNEAQARDFQRWPRLGVWVWPNPDDYWPITTYQGTVDWMKQWIAGRFAWIDSQYPLAPPLFNHPGGFIGPGFYLSISATNPVYFMLDGSDPRLAGGAVSSNALLYAAPFSINTNVAVFARVRTVTGAWGPPAAVSLFTRIPPLVVTEIMYHPPDPPVGSPYSGADFEYLELKSVGPDPMNLRNVCLSGGITFTFSNLVLAAGQQVLVVNNKAAFQSRYGTNIIVAGEFTGHSTNHEDHLILTGPMGEPILDFSYQRAWYPITDGAGFSLVIQNENAPLDTWGLQSSWRPSSAINGSPGRNDGPALAFPAVLINEALTHPAPPALATLELYNASTSEVDMGDWFLTDDFNQPKKFRIPSHPIIAAGGFRLFDESSFSVPNGFGIPFTLKAGGGQVYLFSGDANTNLTGYVHGFSFGAQKNGVTFGRYLTSMGEEHFVAQSSATLGAANSYPLVGPVVIDQIMYHPPDVLVGTEFYDNTEDEYIELHNITGAPVELYDSAYPSNTWELDRAVRYAFPEGKILPAFGYLLVVSFDPVNNPGRLSAFLDKYSVDPGVTPIFGPYTGKLDNSGQTVELKMPDTPGASGEVPYVLVDKVHYDDQAPWLVAADGLGFSLHRVESSGYGDDLINWAAGAPSAGVDYNPGAAPIIVTQPQSQAVVVSTDVSLSVAATGGAPLTYQWRRDGQNLAGATNASLMLTNVQPAQAGQYQAIVLDASGSAMSSNAVLTVVFPIQIAAQSQDRTIRLSSLTNILATNVTFAAVASGGGRALNYQWRFNGVEIPGATNSSYTLNKVSIANHGAFQVQISDALTSALSEPASLNVFVAPVITQALPATISALQGDNVSWTVSAAGFPPPLTFQWRRGPSILTSITQFSGSSTFTLSNVQPSDATLYRAVVTNLASPAHLLPANSVSILTVWADSNSNHIADDWELRYGFDLNDPKVASADPDGDGMSNLQEYLAGTDPTNRLSVFKVDQISLGRPVTLQFGAISNHTYTVQFKNALRDSDWLKLTDLASRSSNWTAIVIDPGTNRSRYYRLVTPEQ